jgi:hypothetical protein
MSSTDEKTGKSGRRNKKGEPRRRKSDSPQSAVPVQTQSPAPDQQLQPEPAQSPMADPAPVVSEAIDAAVASADTRPPDAVAPDLPPTTAPSPAEAGPVSLQTIANAYRDYTRKSFEEIGSYFEQLTGARSLDKAMKVQTEFVTRAYETSVAESQRICELHNQLAKQAFQPFQGLVGKAPETRGKS